MPHVQRALWLRMRADLHHRHLYRDGKLTCAITPIEPGLSFGDTRWLIRRPGQPSEWCNLFPVAIQKGLGVQDPSYATPWFRSYTRTNEYMYSIANGMGINLGTIKLRAGTWSFWDPKTTRDFPGISLGGARRSAVAILEDRGYKVLWPEFLPWVG